jgi:sialidase-1
MGQPTETVVFQAGESGYPLMRIPGIVRSTNQTLLAFCEARWEPPDRSRTDLVLKRSVDGGQTWGPLQVVVASQGELDAWVNPCPVVDSITGKIFLFATLFPDGPVPIREWEALLKYGVIRTIVTESTDDGLTWSTPLDITEQITDVTSDIGKKTGPGAGIQTSTGRLVIPYGLGPELQSRAMIVYSDDHGQSWHASGRVDSTSTETQVAEFSDGSLRLDMRNQRPQEFPRHTRYYSISADGGTTWTERVQDWELLDTACQASILRHPFREPGQDRDPILFSNPASTFGIRVNMTVRMSYDDGNTWPIVRTVHPGPSAYSCLVSLPDGSIGLLYEGGAWVYEGINFARFDVEWLKEGVPRMIVGAIGDNGGGPPGAFDGSITATASSSEGGVRAPDKAINGAGIMQSSGDPTDRDNYEHDAGIGSFGDELNFLSAHGNTTCWFKVDLGQTYPLQDAFFFNFNPDDFEGAGNEIRGVASANIYYLDAASDPNANDDGNASPFDPTDWTQLGSTFNFTQAPFGDVNQTVPDVVDFGGVNARFVALDILSNHGHADFVGFGEIQFFAVQVPEPSVDLVVIEDTLGAMFDSVSNTTYRLQSTPDLVSSNYTDTGAIAIGNGASIIMFDPSGPSTSKNYRVVME